MDDLEKGMNAFKEKHSKFLDISTLQYYEVLGKSSVDVCFSKSNVINTALP